MAQTKPASLHSLLAPWTPGIGKCRHPFQVHLFSDWQSTLYRKSLEGLRSLIFLGLSDAIASTAPCAESDIMQVSQLLRFVPTYFSPDFVVKVVCGFQSCIPRRGISDTIHCCHHLHRTPLSSQPTQGCHLDFARLKSSIVVKCGELMSL